MNFLGIVFGGAVVLALLALWVYALVSAIQNERLDSARRLAWVLVILLVNGLGALLYLLIAPNRPSAEEIRLAAALRRRDALQRVMRRA
ncbi:PLD nuclease N-terminal domain-containing protein [Oleiharenicola sp. Vm1]|uniref:PLD nuclease N-terminal domain-containing protein n=1 Tax=Oleiharenicola sp. Vm1 TaxID=3398393 RepID=UPI0039F4C032